MPFNGSGTFVSLAPPDFPAVPFTTILASMFNANLNDIFTNGLTKCLTRDGQSPPTANLPMAGFKFTSLGNGSADGDSAALGQTIAARGLVGAVDWDSRTSLGMFEVTSVALTAPATNFPPTSELGQLIVLAQGVNVVQKYVTSIQIFLRRKISGVWTSWVLANQGTSRFNYIVNPAIEAWQAGTTVTAGTGKRYGADQFFVDSTGTTTSMTQQVVPIGQTDFDPSAKFFLRAQTSSSAGASNFGLVAGVIESATTLANKIVTLSFWAKAGSTQSIALELQQIFGTGGSPSATVNTLILKQALTTSWARYQFTFTVPSVSGKALGSNGDDYLRVNFWMDAGSTFNTRTNTLGQQSMILDLWGVKLEEGTYATDFLVPDTADNLYECSRFYEYVHACAGSAFSPGAAGAIAMSGVTFQATKRAVPTVDLSSTILNTNTSNVQTSAIDIHGFRFVVTQGLASGNFNDHHLYTFSARF